MGYLHRLVGAGLVIGGILVSGVIGGIGVAYYSGQNQDFARKLQKVISQINPFYVHGADSYRPSECLTISANVNLDSLNAVSEISQYLDPSQYRLFGEDSIRAETVSLENAILADLRCGDDQLELVMALYTPAPMDPIAMGTTHVIALDENYKQISPKIPLIFTGQPILYAKQLNGDKSPEILILGRMADGGNHPAALVHILTYTGNELKQLDIGVKNAVGNPSPLAVYPSIQIADLSGDGIADLLATEANYSPNDPLCCPSRIDKYLLRWNGSQFVRDENSLVSEYAPPEEVLHNVGEENVHAILFDNSVEPNARVEQLKQYTGITDNNFIGLLIHTALQDEYVIPSDDLSDGQAELIPYREIENQILRDVRERHFEGREPNPLLVTGVSILSNYYGIPLTQEEKEVAALAAAVYGEKLLVSTLGEPLIENGRELYPLGETRDGRTIYLPTLLPEESQALQDFYVLAQNDPIAAKRLAIGFLEGYTGVTLGDMTYSSGIDINSEIDMRKVNDFVDGLEKLNANIDDLDLTFVRTDILPAGIDKRFDNLVDDLFDN